MAINVTKILSFLISTFTINFLLVIVYLGTNNKWIPPASFIISAIYMLVPMLVTIVIQKFIYRENLNVLGISFNINTWFFIAWVLPIIIAFMTVVVSILLPGIKYAPDFGGISQILGTVVKPEELSKIQSDLARTPNYIFIFTGIAQALIAGITINAVFAFGEELGWRGFLQKELAILGFWKSSIIIGLTWGVWHAPLILQGHNYSQHPKLGVFMMIICTLLMAPIFNYVRIKSNSVIAVSIMHGTLNAIAALPIILVQGGNDLTVGITGLSGFIALIVVNLYFFIYDIGFARQSIMLN
jgi:uncharacterized protein